MESNMPSGQMPGDFRVLNRHKKGARKARREALGLPDPEPTPPKNPKKKPKKLPKHRRQQPSVAKGHICRKYPCYSYYHRCNRPNRSNNHGRLESSQGRSPPGFIDHRNFQTEQMRCLQKKVDMIHSGIMPQPPTSLTLRRFSSFAAAWRQQEDHHQRAERAQHQFENERKRREADDFYVSTMMDEMPGAMP